jgi:hypothetical protein
MRNFPYSSGLEYHTFILLNDKTVVRGMWDPVLDFVTIKLEKPIDVIKPIEYLIRHELFHIGVAIGTDAKRTILLNYFKNKNEAKKIRDLFEPIYEASANYYAMNIGVEISKQDKKLIESYINTEPTRSFYKLLDESVTKFKESYMGSKSDKEVLSATLTAITRTCLNTNPLTIKGTLREISKLDSKKIPQWRENRHLSLNASAQMTVEGILTSRQIRQIPQPLLYEDIMLANLLAHLTKNIDLIPPSFINETTRLLICAPHRFINIPIGVCPWVHSNLRELKHKINVLMQEEWLRTSVKKAYLRLCNNLVKILESRKQCDDKCPKNTTDLVTQCFFKFYEIFLN